MSVKAWAVMVRLLSDRIPHSRRDHAGLGEAAFVPLRLTMTAIASNSA